MTIVCRLKNEAGLPIDDDYLYEEFGIPKPDNYDEMKAAQQTAASATEEQAGSEDGESTDEDDPTKTGTEPKKNRKLTDRVRDFSAAPRKRGGGFRLVVDTLYIDAAEKRPAENGFSFDSGVLAAALRNIYERRYNPRTEIDAELFEEVSRIFDAATDAGFSGSEAGGDFMEQLRTNNAVFAAFKTHRMGRDMAAQLIDETAR